MIHHQPDNEICTDDMTKKHAHITMMLTCTHANVPGCMTMDALLIFGATYIKFTPKHPNVLNDYATMTKAMNVIKKAKLKFIQCLTVHVMSEVPMSTHGVLHYWLSWIFLLGSLDMHWSK